MANGMASIEAFAHGKVIPFTIDDIKKARKSFPKSAVAVVLEELYSNMGEWRWLGTIDDSNPEGINKAASKIRDGIIAAYGNSMSKVTKTKAVGATGLKHIGILVTLSKLVDKEEFIAILGPLSAKLKKVASVIASPVLAGTLGTLNSAMGENAVTDISDELSDIRDEVEKEPRGLPLTQVTTILLRGANKGLTSARQLAVGQPVPSGIEQQILQIIRINVAPVMTKALVIDEGVAETLGENLAALMLMAANPDTFPSPEALKEFDRRRKMLVLARGWEGMVGTGMASAINGFGKGGVKSENQEQKTKDQGKPADAGQTNKGQSNQKQEIRDWFLSGKNGQIEKLAEWRRFSRLPDKKIDPNIQPQIDSDFEVAADTYLADAGKQAPMEGAIKGAGGAFYMLMLVFASGIGEKQDQNIMQRAIQDLKNVWPGYGKVVSKGWGWARNGIVSKMINTGIIGPGDSMSSAKYQMLFDKTYNILENKIREATCQPPETSMCLAFGAIRKEIDNDKKILARPKDVKKLFADKGMQTNNSFPLAEDVVSSVIRSVNEGQEIDDIVIGKLADELILHIGMKGNAYGIDKLPKNDAKRRKEQEDKLWHKLPESNVEGLEKQKAEKEQATKDVTANISVWGNPETIMFGSFVLWWIGRGVEGFSIR